MHKKKIILFIILVLSLSIVGCQSSQKPKMISKITMESPKTNSDILTYEEEKIKFTFLFDKQGVGAIFEGIQNGYSYSMWLDHPTLAIVNNSDESIQVNWDKASFINEDGYVERLINGKRKVKNVGEATLKTQMPSGSKIAEKIIPESNIEVTEYGIIDGNIAKISKDNDKRKIEKKVSYIIPIIKDGETKEYRFDINIFIKAEPK